ncbi:hypothetical protein BG000_003069 [Podila horticola]|nr:hypothetical protein BG000_003069 [Podila horticola]
MDTLAAEGYFTFSDKVTAKYYAFSTPWQLEQALIYGDIVILDIRKQVYGPSSRLNTLLVVHSETGIAIPVSYLLTRDHRTSIIAGWLNALTAHIKSKLGVVYAPKVVFASLSNIKFDAVQALFPKGRALCCNFYTASHVQGKIQSFMKAATKGNGPEANVDTIEMMNEASRQFKEELMKEEDLVVATANLSLYRRRWKGYQFLQFLETDYFAEDKRRRWMYAHRQDISYGNIVSFDHCNSWHRSLTSHFDMDVSQTREDRVIQVLARVTDQKFQKSIVGDGMTLSGHNPPSKDDNLRNGRAAKETKDAGHSSALITRINRNTMGVKSFESIQASSETSSPTMYNIAVDPNERQIFSCSCRYFFLFRRPCEHIELVKLEDYMYTFEVKPAFAKPDVGPNPQQSLTLTQYASSTSPIESTDRASPPAAEARAQRTPSSETASVTISIISDPHSPSSGSSRSPQGKIQSSSRYSLPDVVSPLSASGTSQAASKRRLRDLDRGSPIIEEESPPSEVEPASASSEVSPAVVATIKNGLETIRIGSKDLPGRHGIEACLETISVFVNKDPKVQRKKRRLM